MTAEFDVSSLTWRTLDEMYRYYLARTPSEDFISAAEVIERAKQQSLLRDIMNRRIASGEATPDQVQEVLTEAGALDAQASRMKIITRHLMVRDASAGHWFAVGTTESSDQPELIHPKHWNFLLVDCEQNRAWKEPSLQFKDVHGVLTEDLPGDHPLVRAIQHAANADTKFQQASSPPPMVPSPSIAAYPTALLPRTGAPGRPSFSMPLIVREAEERVAKGLLLPTLTAQAADLHNWFVTTHPQLPEPSVRTIENKIRPIYNKAKRTALTPTKL